MRPIEKEYSPSRWVKRMDPDKVTEKCMELIAKESADVIKDINCHLNIPYGPKPTQKLDIFGVDVLPKSAPVFLFIHGGYWQDCRHDQYRFLSKPFVDCGAVVVVLGYDLAPSVTVAEIVEEVTEGTRYVIKMANERGSSGLYISGHSAGGHLCAMMLTTKWTDGEINKTNILKGVIPVSGVFDVRPITQTYINDPLKLTEESAWQLSPLRFARDGKLYCDDIEVLIIVAEDDPPAFHQQATTFKDALRNSGAKNMRVLMIPETDHFNVMENMSKQDFLVTKEILEMMNLKNR